MMATPSPRRSRGPEGAAPTPSPFLVEEGSPGFPGNGSLPLGSVGERTWKALTASFACGGGKQKRDFRPGFDDLVGGAHAWPQGPKGAASPRSFFIFLFLFFFFKVGGTVLTQVFLRVYLL